GSLGLQPEARSSAICRRSGRRTEGRRVLPDTGAALAEAAPASCAGGARRGRTGSGGGDRVEDASSAEGVAGRAAGAAPSGTAAGSAAAAGGSAGHGSALGAAASSAASWKTV